MLDVKTIKLNECVGRRELLNILSERNYEKRTLVTRPGEYAYRGGIFDIYPVTYRAPIRVEFEGDSIITIRDFSPIDGKSLTSFDEFFLIPVTGTFEKKIEWARKNYENYDPLTKIKDIAAGDYVVHYQYGIGRFLGSKVIQVKGERIRHMALEYAGGDILYLDVRESIERYIGSEGRAPKLTKLHSKEWERLKAKTRRAVSSVAHDLIEIQAKRSFGKGFRFPKDNDWQREFEAQFPFQATPDQTKSTREVKKDMESLKPMDRLLAGDVGYGKTEVAMRAAFKAVMGGQQVAFLVPTTVLAEQHYLSFKQRLKNFPVSIEVLSRFRSKKEQLAIVKSLKDGMTDIVIGTHRLLSKDIKFKKMGLVIIDEEQRFGVRHKERLKQFRSQVDVLTLTATPIPRTLYMALVGVRDMSSIQTPPENRMPVETAVMEYRDDIVVDAVQKELSRGGQVYFVHNRVQSIEKISEHLKKILPHVKFSVAHGQMPPQSLENVMQEFMEHRSDCLIATSIIESGIDIPNVNTIIVNRADMFGLSDMYQLRGRVGRFHKKRQAYAYFLVPKNWVMTQDAEKRLSAIERFTELGSGFRIALEDLEIRGAGNLLGHQQSGFIHAVGFDLYCRLLKEAVEAEKKGKKPLVSAKSDLASSS